MIPNAIPAIAPVNSDGANTPPEPPIESVRLAGDDLAEHQDHDEPQHHVTRHALSITG